MWLDDSVKLFYTDSESKLISKYAIYLCENSVVIIILSTSE